MYGTFWALLPPIIAIALALITKEVYSSLFIGIVVGGLFYSGFSFVGTLTHIFQEGMIAQLTDAYNVGSASGLPNISGPVWAPSWRPWHWVS